MDKILKDERFSHIAHDPRFRRLPKKEKKVNIDKRFMSMFKDKRFKVKYTVDKRGRHTDHTSTEDLKRYYNLPSSSDSDAELSDKDDDDDEEEECLENEKTDLKKGKIKKDKQVEKKKSILRIGVEASGSSEEVESGDDHSDDIENDHVHENVLTEIVKNKLRDLTVDYARGEGALFSDSSSGDESDDESKVSSEEDLEHGWGELDKDAETTNEITNRVAVCNMDWDRIRATDLMVLFNSFLPKGGLIQSVTVYPSEFGLERMKEEEVKGPTEIHNTKSDDEDDEGVDSSDDAEETEEGKKYHMEKLRQYQLNRLKYFYAVLVCDSPETANKLYTDCDGLEYESSATRLDLRFIPDDTTFDQEPREMCSQLPDLSKYQPRYFTTTALQQAKVELTWDETDPNRTEITQKLMSGKVDDVEDADIRAYLALSSEDEEEQDAENDQVEEDGDENDETSSQIDPILRYRALLQDIEQEEEKKKAKDIEMEVTWGIGLKDKTEKLVKQKLKETVPSLTPFQQYLEKRKEKRKKKKEERLKLKEKSGEDEENTEEENKAFSDDDIPSDIDMNDPYFKEEMEGYEKKNKKKNEKKKKNQGKEGVDKEEDKQTQAELELLLMNDADDKHHFSLKSIQEQESESKSKRRRKKKKNVKAEEAQSNGADDFKLNLSDERFSAIFSSHLYNIDPADPHYRKTKAMEALRIEKLKRRQEEEQTPAKIQRLGNSKKDPELSLLVKKIKRKSEELKK